MEILPKRNLIITLAAILVVAMGLMAMSLFVKRPKLQKVFISDIQKIETQSSSDSIGSIEKDLEETDLSDIDKELQDIEREFL